MRTILICAVTFGFLFNVVSSVVITRPSEAEVASLVANAFLSSIVASGHNGPFNATDTMSLGTLADPKTAIAGMYYNTFSAKTANTIVFGSQLGTSFRSVNGFDNEFLVVPGANVSQIIIVARLIGGGTEAMNIGDIGLNGTAYSDVLHVDSLKSFDAVSYEYGGDITQLNFSSQFFAGSNPGVLEFQAYGITPIPEYPDVLLISGFLGFVILVHNRKKIRNALRIRIGQ